MLTALLPLIEGLASEGGIAASLGGGVRLGGAASAGGGGLGGTLGRLFSGTKPFGSSDELGEAVQRMSNLSEQISRAQAAMSSGREQQESVASTTREQERLYAFSDPSHREQLAQLAHQQQQRANEVQQLERSRAELSRRAAMTTDPSAGRSSVFGRAGLLMAGGQAVQSYGPTVARNLPGVQAAQNLGGFAAGPVNSAIVGQAAHAATSGVSHVAGAALQGAGIGSLAGPVGTGVGAAIGGLTGAASELSALPGHLVEWADGLKESQRSLSRFNGELAASFANSDRRDMVRGMESANRTSGTTSDLSNSLGDLADSLQPIRDEIHNTVGTSLNIGVKTLNQVVGLLDDIFKATEVLKTVAESVKNIEEYFFGEQSKKTPGGDIAQRLWTDIKLHDARKPREVPRR